MKKILKILLLLLLTGGAVLFLTRSVLFPDDGTRIKTALAELTAALAKSGNESPANALLQSKSAADCFTEPAAITVPQLRLRGSFHRAALLNYAARYRTWCRSAAVSVADLQITFSARDHATVIFTGEIRGIGKSGERFSETADVETEWRKIDGKWRIAELTVIPVLH